ncbi:hypothetical protein [Bacillus glycinifermentans]|uniref:Uncharacterized protein n=1 Tax=Bacillus glycinifermentans TaxID=1664069 RepID=A0A0T6BK27_9BACI|nr:hypothetical protein [Bacillus glycinifermentans]ATH93643.1 hypothetical protein COP00_14260 [Bacillus glycinifermentans]KRT90183.1 hypothetical protein AB447_206265 [Bacillus glycinifermentans]MEC0483869.1 hypothetical protein [Bacillus glycinifermentans]
MISFLVLFSLSFMAVCFIFFTVLYAAVNLQQKQANPFQKAAEQTVDTVLLLPLSWLFTTAYITGLIFLIPVRFMLTIFQRKR